MKSGTLSDLYFITRSIAPVKEEFFFFISSITFIPIPIPVHAASCGLYFFFIFLGGVNRIIQRAIV